MGRVKPGTTPHVLRKQLRTTSSGPATQCARVVQIVCPRNNERAQGMPGEGLTHGPPAKKMQAAGTTGSARSSGTPCAMVLTAASRSPRCAGLAGHRVRMMLSHQRGYQRRGIRTTRLDRPPQARSSRTLERPPLPAATHRDDRPRRPSSSRRDARKYPGDLPDDARLRMCDKVTRRAVCAWRGDA